jgi:hypothetical protein
MVCSSIAARAQAQEQGRAEETRHLIETLQRKDEDREKEKALQVRMEEPTI